MAISVWEQSTYFAPNDFVIVGCGFVGLWTAYEAIQKNPKLNITILERGVIPSGASTRNAGFSCFGSVSELMYDVQLMGEAAMLETVKMRYDGLQRIQKVFKAKEIDYNQWGGYELFEGKKHVKDKKGKAPHKLLIACSLCRPGLLSLLVVQMSKVSHRPPLRLSSAPSKV